VLKGCHLNAIDATRIKIMAAERNIPILILDSDYGDGDIGQLKIRIEAFLEMIKARKEEELLEG
jgi:benzoyl-CoA reductase/2-hydroxyglutaryl-CoA dehydratase subunit BcrC/BadD/HgdB